MQFTYINSSTKFDTCIHIKGLIYLYLIHLNDRYMFLIGVYTFQTIPEANTSLLFLKISWLMIGFDINSYEFECEKKKHLLKQHNC